MRPKLTQTPKQKQKHHQMYKYGLFRCVTQVTAGSVSQLFKFARIKVSVALQNILTSVNQP